MIGAFVEIQSNVKIGDRVRVQSHTFICSQVVIEDDVFIGHGVMFTNDKYPKSGVSGRLESTIVRKGASIGSNSTILPVEIGEGALIGAGSVVTRPVPAFAVVAGNPAKSLNPKKI